MRSVLFAALLILLWPLHGFSQATSVRLIGATSDSLIVAYTAPNGNTCDLAVATDSGFVSIVSSGTDAGGNRNRSFVATGLTPATTYYYRVNCAATPVDSSVVTPSGIAGETYFKVGFHPPAVLQQVGTVSQVNVRWGLTSGTLNAGTAVACSGGICTADVGPVAKDTIQYLKYEWKNVGGTILASSKAIPFFVREGEGLPIPSAPTLLSPTNGQSNVATSTTLAWNVAANAESYDVYLGTTTSPSVAGNTVATTYTPSSLNTSTQYFWKVAAKNSNGEAASGLWSFTTASSGGGGGGSSTLVYTSPYCDEGTGSTAWACGAWPSTTAPTIGGAGTITTDPATGNRVLRATTGGSFGQATNVAFFTNYDGWTYGWNADNTAFIVRTYGGSDPGKYWVGFNPTTFALDGTNGRIPNNFSGDGFTWDPTDPDLLVGLWGTDVRSWNRDTNINTLIFTPSSSMPAAKLIEAKGNVICVGEGESGWRVACYDRSTSTQKFIDLAAQTINGSAFGITYKGSPFSLTSAVRIHAIVLGLDGRWLFVDTQNTGACDATGIGSYGYKGVAIDLVTHAAYAWSISCVQTHVALGYDGVMVQNTAAYWNSTGFTGTANGGCSNDDDRGNARRILGSTIDSSFYQTYCPPTPAAYGISTHLSWSNNANDADKNNYPVIGAGFKINNTNKFLYNDIYGIEQTQAAKTNRVWRFAQHYNDLSTAQCLPMNTISPSVSRDGRFAIYPSTWAGQVGTGTCGLNRTDVFVFELK